MKKLLVFGVSIFLLLVVGVAGGVVVNEVMPRTIEYVEIYNENNEVLNLSEWKIKDSSTNNPDEITCYNIPNCSLIINFSYFLVIGRNTNISEITFQEINYFYVDDSSVGNGINDNGDNITFFNSTFATSFSYNSSESGKSWQLCNETWSEAEPTPGETNLCEINQPDQNQTDQNQTDQNQTDSGEAELEMEADYDEEIKSDEDLEVEIELYNLEDKSYDIKITIEDDDDNTLSEIYDEVNERWKSSFNYINGVVGGPGNKSIKLKIRLKEEYKDFDGEADIKIKLREDGGVDAVSSITNTINIEGVENSNNDNSNDNTVTNTNNDNTVGITSNVIRLNPPKDIKIDENSENIYKSKAQYIKEYAIYGFSIFCVIVIIFLLLKKF